MKVRVSQNRINSILSVIVSTEDWSRHELDAIVRFGEPKIQIGGRFLKHCTKCMHPRHGQHGPEADRLRSEIGRIIESEIETGYRPPKELVDLVAPKPPCDCDSNDEDPSCWFELPEQEKGVRSDLPILVEFGSDDFDDPELCARSWADEIVGRIARAVEGLRRENANLVKEEVYEF